MRFLGPAASAASGSGSSRGQAGLLGRRGLSRPRAGQSKVGLSKRIGAALAVAALAVAVSGCGNSADPDNWSEAEETGAVRENFMESCLLANEETAGSQLNPASVQAFCQCTFQRLRDTLEFDEFKELDRALRDTPNPSDLDDDEGETAEASWDGQAERIIRGCLPRSAA